MTLRTAAIVALMMMAAVPSGRAQRGAARVPGGPAVPDQDALRKWQTLLRIEDARDPAADDLNFLVALARQPDRTPIAALAPLDIAGVRTLGRLGRLDLIPTLRGFLPDARLRHAAEIGLLLTLRENAAGAGQAIADTVNDLIAMPASPVVLGNLPITAADQFTAADDRLRTVLNDPKGARAAAARGLEALARRNRKLGRLSDETAVLLERGATWRLPDMRPKLDDPLAVNALAALIAAGRAGETVVADAFRRTDPELRRLGAVALFGGGTTIDAHRRAELIGEALKDREPLVRYEGLRAWARWQAAGDGCGAILHALSDHHDAIVLTAIDALGDRCQADETVTARLIGEVQSPPPGVRWQREAHALVALAKRSPDRAASALPAFSRHQTWQVRMYAARAAAIVKDVETLKLLAFDGDANVRHAALPPLRGLIGADSDAACLAALASDDYQLVRTVALLLEQAGPDRQLAAALAAALGRITAQRKDTSRDVRLALVQRLGEQAGPEAADALEALLTDFDERVASEAAAAFATLTARPARASPRPLPRPPPPTVQELLENVVARVELEAGGSFDITFSKGQAPLAYARFARLARAKYFDGLTFHRVVPGFVVQGGSPGANEYAGDAVYMRDELSDGQHAAGTVGISTRGHHTGDAQLFINLVDNRTLEFEYTVFGTITQARGGADVQAIQEGTRIRRMTMMPATATSR